MKNRVIGILRLTVRLLMTVIRFLSGGKLCSCKRNDGNVSEETEE